MLKRLVIACVVAAGAIWLVSWRASERTTALSHKPATHTVTIEEMRVDPEVLQVSAGDSVVWVNKDLFPHTATSKAGGFDSQQIGANESWRRRFEEQGEFSYVCALHPPMKATIRVK